MAICQKAIDEFKARAESTGGEAVLSIAQLRFIYDTDIDREGDFQDIIDIIEAYEWVTEVIVYWSMQTLIVRTVVIE